MSEAPKTLLEGALALAVRGWRVVPLHNLLADGKTCSCQEWRDSKKRGPCPSEGKHPRFLDFAKLASADEKKIRAWWRTYPDANIGLILGAESGIWALDTDPRNSGDWARGALLAKHGQFPDGAKVRTGGGGSHEYFRWPADFAVPSMLEIEPGLEVVGQDHVLVAPPSLHKSGQQYEWDEFTDEGAIPEPVDAPAWLLDIIRARMQAPAAAAAKAGDRGGWPEADIGKILQGCAWMRHCSDDAAQLSEPEWYAQLSILGRCRNALELAQELSSPHSQYNASATAAKLQHAMRDAGPVTCAKVRHSLAGARFCDVCSNAGRVKSPVVLGNVSPSLGFQSAPAENGNYSSRQPEAVKGGGDSGPDLTKNPLTDAGNAERMVLLYRGRIRYCVEMKKWLVWDGRRWAIDEKQSIKQLAKRMARTLYLQADGISDRGVLEATEKWARKSESAAGINATLVSTEHEPGIPVSALDLDTHPFLLNCLNGTLDLKSQSILPHNPDFLITKLCNAEYRPDAKCPRFLKFLERIMGANEDAEIDGRTASLIGFLQRAFGYSLTGDVSAKSVFCFFGKGNNGKSTLLEAFTGHLFKEYSAQLDINTLLVKPGGESNATLSDLADVRGARLVTTSEPEDGQRLKVGKLKYLSAGMGEIKSMKKFENSITFKATHKLFLDGNHRPIVPAGGDEALWGRLKPVPFRIIIPPEERDGQLGDKLKAEADGILAWAVRGCALWLASGLGDPPDVGEEKDSWRSKSDPIQEFLEDCCDLDPESYCRITDLAQAYARWCEEAGEKYPLNRVKFADQLELRGLKRTKGYIDGASGVRMWRGLTVKSQYLTARF